MFKVDCPGCASPYQVDERRVPERGLKMRCPKCGHSFRVEQPGFPAAKAPAAPAPAQRAPLQSRDAAKSTLLGLERRPQRAPPAGAQGSLSREIDLPGPQELDLPGTRQEPTQTVAGIQPVELARLNLLKTAAGFSGDIDLPLAVPPTKGVALPARTVDFPAAVPPTVKAVGVAAPAAPFPKATDLPAPLAPPYKGGPVTAPVTEPSEQGFDDFGEIDLGTLKSHEAPIIAPPIDLPEVIDVHAKTAFMFGPSGDDPGFEPTLRERGAPAPPRLQDQPTLKGPPVGRQAARTAKGAQVPEIELPDLDLSEPSADYVPAEPAQARPPLAPAFAPAAPPDLEAPVRRPSVSSAYLAGDADPLDLDGPAEPGMYGRDDEPLELVGAPARPPSTSSFALGGDSPGGLIARAPSVTDSFLVDDSDPGAFGELELPEIEPGDVGSDSPERAREGPLIQSLLKPAPTGGPLRRPSRDVPSLLSHDVGRSDAGGAAASAPQGERSAERYAGGGTGYGEVTLDTSMGVSVPIEASGDDDMEFGGIPQEQAGAAGPRPTQAPEAAPSRLSKVAAPRTLADAAPKKKRRLSKRILAVVLGLLVIVGSALSFLPDVGPFGAHYLNDRLKAREYKALMDKASADARRLLAKDGYKDGERASALLDAARAKGKRLYALDAYAAYVGYMREVRFGNDPAALARARVILQELAERRDLDTLLLARAAQDAASDKVQAARVNVTHILKRTPKNVDALALAAEIELAAGNADAALPAWKALEQVEPSARALFGIARSQHIAGDHKATQAALRTVLEKFPGHAGAKLLLAELLFKHEVGKYTEIQALLEEVAKDTEMVSPEELVRAHTLAGDFALSRSQVSQAETAYLAALKINPKTARALLGLGEVLYANGRYTDAQARFEAASKAVPDDLGAVLGYAKTQLALERSAEASKVLKQLRDKEPKSSEVAYWHGRVLENEGKRKEAAEAFRVAIDLGGKDPRTVLSYVALALLHNKEGHWDDAEKLLNEAKSALEHSPAIHKALGQLAFSRGRNTQALEEFRLAEAADPTDAEVKFRIAAVLRQERKFDEAEQVLEAVAKLDPKYPGLTLERGILSEAAGKPALALKAYEEALSAAPDDLDMTLRVGCAKMVAGRLEEAEDLLRKVLKQRPVSAEANHCLGRALLAEGFHPVAALTPLNRSVELSPHRGDYWLYVGWAASESGNSKKAEEALSKAIELDRDLGDAYWQRGILRKRQGAVRDALEDLLRALKHNPSRYEVHASLAEVYYDLGQEPAAIAHWGKAVAANPTDATWRYRLGRMLLPNQHHVMAAQHLTAALELGAKMRPLPRWMWEAHRLLAEALGESPKAIPHLEAFLKTGPSDSPYRSEAKAALKRLGHPWRGP